MCQSTQWNPGYISSSVVLFSFNPVSSRSSDITALVQCSPIFLPAYAIWLCVHRATKAALGRKDELQLPLLLPEQLCPSFNSCLRHSSSCSLPTFLLRPLPVPAGQALVPLLPFSDRVIYSNFTPLRCQVVPTIRVNSIQSCVSSAKWILR